MCVIKIDEIREGRMMRFRIRSPLRELFISLCSRYIWCVVTINNRKTQEIRSPQSNNHSPVFNPFRIVTTIDWATNKQKHASTLALTIVDFWEPVPRNCNFRVSAIKNLNSLLTIMASIVYQCKRCSNMLTDSNCIISEKDPLVFLSSTSSPR